MLRKILFLSLMSCFMALVNAQTKHNGHEYVDLGLSVKWATCNVGATTPEGYGDYYAWGETVTKSNYDWSTYKWCKGRADALTKYCMDGVYGKVDKKNTLSATDDVAHVKWGGNWRMPTHAEQKELRKCTWTWTTKNGVNGYIVVGPNGNSIFLPAAGYRNGEELRTAGSDGYYWNSSTDVYHSPSVYCLFFFSSSWGWGNKYRCSGRSVRPVCP